MEKFRVVEAVGEGGYGRVYRGEHVESGEVVAIKEFKYDNSGGMVPCYLREVANLVRAAKVNKFGHIMEPYGFIFDEPKKQIFMILEYAPYDLHTFIFKAKSGGQLPTVQIRDILFQVVLALDTLHGANIVHRDVKPANILMQQSGKILLADLGMARSALYRMGRKSTNVQTTWYKAPELLCNCPRYLCAVDMWSVGCVLFEMLSVKSQPALFGEDDEDQFDRVFELLSPDDKQQDRYFPSFTSTQLCYFSKALQKEMRVIDDLDMLDLLLRFLTVDPDQRITAREALFHPFFKDILSGHYTLGSQTQSAHS